MTFRQMLNHADSGENCILCFGDNETACSFVDFVSTQRSLNGNESEPYSCGSHQLRYQLGVCKGTSLKGFDTDFYRHKYDNLYRFYYYGTSKVV